MKLGNTSEHTNELAVSIDWLSFTLKDCTEAGSALKLLGYSDADFVELKKGRQGYKSVKKNNLYNIFICYNGNSDMGVHVDISGSAIGDVFQHYHDKRLVPSPFGGLAYKMDDMDERFTRNANMENILLSTVACDLLREIREMGGSLTRLDLAIDDFGARYFSVNDVYDVLDAGMVSMLFKSYRLEKGRSADGKTLGETIYVGTRQSACFLRVYDKKLEQNQKLRNLGKPLIENEWVRWELELKDDRAINAGLELEKGDNLGKVVTGILSHYMRMILLDKDRKTRCSTLPSWDAFISNVDELSIASPFVPKTIEDKESWIIRQVAPSLATIVLAHCGDMDFVYRAITDGADRIKLVNRKMILAYQDAN